MFIYILSQSSERIKEFQNQGRRALELGSWDCFDATSHIPTFSNTMFTITDCSVYPLIPPRHLQVIPPLVYRAIFEIDYGSLSLPFHTWINCYKPFALCKQAAVFISQTLTDPSSYPTHNLFPMTNQNKKKFLKKTRGPWATWLT